MDRQEQERQEKLNTHKKRKQVVVQSNELILQRTTAHLTVTQKKLICYVISLIRPEDEEFKAYEITVTDFCNITGTHEKHFYRDFKAIIDGIDDNTNSFWVENETTLFKFRWFSIAEYKKGKGIIRLMFNNNLKPHLLRLRKDFTQYGLYEIISLKSKHSMRLYEILKAFSFLEVKKFELEELKSLLYCNTNAYKDFKNFRVRVLDIAVNEINAKTSINVEYEKVTVKKKIVAILFKISNKDTLDRVFTEVKDMELLDGEYKNNENN